MAEDPRDLAASLRRWAKTAAPHTRAAAELLIRHGYWLHQPAFIAAAVIASADGPGISWADARQFCATTAVGTGPQLAALEMAVTLGEGHGHWAGIDAKVLGAAGEALASVGVPTGGGWVPQDETQHKRVYRTLEDFVNIYLAALIQRKLGTLKWCKFWWKHEEAVTRLNILWNIWEEYRHQYPDGLSEWMLHHLAAHLDVLMSSDNGPFMHCNAEEGQHNEPPSLPCAPDIEGRLAAPQFNVQDSTAEDDASPPAPPFPSGLPKEDDER